MLEKLMEKKSIGVILGLVPIILVFLLFPLENMCGFYSQCFVFVRSLALSSGLYTFALIVSIPTCLMREELHSYWFKWMMVRYMPVACILTFLMALAESGHGSGWGPQVNGIGTVFAILFFSALFIVLSIILIVTKYASLKKKR